MARNGLPPCCSDTTIELGGRPAPPPPTLSAKPLVSTVPGGTDCDVTADPVTKLTCMFVAAVAVAVTVWARNAATEQQETTTSTKTRIGIPFLSTHGMRPAPICLASRRRCHPARGRST